MVTHYTPSYYPYQNPSNPYPLRVPYGGGGALMQQGYPQPQPSHETKEAHPTVDSKADSVTLSAPKQETHPEKSIVAKKPKKTPAKKTLEFSPVGVGVGAVLGGVAGGFGVKLSQWGTTLSETKTEKQPPPTTEPKASATPAKKSKPVKATPLQTPPPVKGEPLAIENAPFSLNEGYEWRDPTNYLAITHTETGIAYELTGDYTSIHKAEGTVENGNFSWSYGNKLKKLVKLSPTDPTYWEIHYEIESQNRKTLKVAFFKNLKDSTQKPLKFDWLGHTFSPSQDIKDRISMGFLPTGITPDQVNRWQKQLNDFKTGKPIFDALDKITIPTYENLVTFLSTEASEATQAVAHTQATQSIAESLGIPKEATVKPVGKEATKAVEKTIKKLNIPYIVGGAIGLGLLGGLLGYFLTKEIKDEPA